jgi:hypothetical protein
MQYLCPKCKQRNLCRDNHTPGGKQRWSCRPQSGGVRVSCYTTTDPTAPYRDHAGNTKAKPLKFQQKVERKRLIITAAQNATPVHKGFWNALQIAAKHMGAQILVIPLRYKNPTSRWSGSQENAETWADELRPFLCNQRLKLNKNLVLVGDVKVQPTATEPLTGFDAITHGESGILGHTKMQLRSIPTPQAKMAKILTTTGACTVANYTDSKAGALGAFHHTLGAVLVEIDGPTFHLRQLNGDKDNGSFIDLDQVYGADWTRSGVADAPAPLALAMGDTHVGSICPGVEAATFGPAGIVPTLKPRHLIWHDLFDGYAVNHHHDGNVFQAYAKAQSGKFDVAAEVTAACKYVVDRTPADCQSVVVSSNHDDFLRRWIIAKDWRQDPRNAKFYLSTAMAMLDSTRSGPGGMEVQSPFRYWMSLLAPTARVLGGNESFQLGGIELGMHGDRGPNGARGSIRNLRRIGVRSVIGHSHSPGISEGAYQVGTSTRLQLEYNRGPSSWLNAHCLVYANGKRCLITIVNGAWRMK